MVLYEAYISLPPDDDSHVCVDHNRSFLVSVLHLVCSTFCLVILLWTLINSTCRLYLNLGELVAKINKYDNRECFFRVVVIYNQRLLA